MWAHILTKQCLKLKDKGQTFQANCTTNTRVAVIVEPRLHPFLEPVIRNVMHFLGSGWNLEIVTSERNIPYIENCFPGCTFRITTVPYDNMNQTLYNHLLMDPWFWWRIPEEHILIFQTDCIMFRRGMDEWMDFDYVGANYFNPDETAVEYGGVQGGFSLRRKSAMLECLNKVSLSDVQRWRNSNGLKPLTRFHEDVYFTHACEMLKKKVPDVDIRKLFSIEAEYFPCPIGHHGTTKAYFDNHQIREIISRSEDRELWSLP